MEVNKSAFEVSGEQHKAGRGEPGFEGFGVLVEEKLVSVVTGPKKGLQNVCMAKNLSNPE